MWDVMSQALKLSNVFAFGYASWKAICILNICFFQIESRGDGKQSANSLWAVFISHIGEFIKIIILLEN
jgi:hypothetical protein